MRRLAILGASGHGKVVADTAQCCGWEFIEFFDDAWPSLQSLGHWPVLGSTAMLLERIDEFDGVIVAIGNNAVRLCKLEMLAAVGARVCNLVHPGAIISRYADLGMGTVVFAGAVVNADVCMGLGCIINTGSSVDHDCVLGAAVHISPGARLAGGVKVGDLSWVGIGASVRQLVYIGTNVLVGAGAAVVADVADGLTVAGVPAKVMRAGKAT